MADEIAIDTRTLEWTPTRWPGILLKPLRREDSGPRTVLMKFEPGGRVPRHMHPAGEEILVLEGRVGVEGVWYEAGCYVRSPAGSSNDAYSDTGGLALVMLPKPHVDLE
jgi:anti-sigma factor ChrR (cupin superfamily)